MTPAKNFLFFEAIRNPPEKLPITENDMFYDRFQPESREDALNRGRTVREIAHPAPTLGASFIDPRLAREAEIKRQPLLDEINRWNSTTPIGRKTVCERSELKGA